MVTAWHPLLLLLVGLAGYPGSVYARGCHYATRCLSGPCGPGGPCRSTSVGTVCAAGQCGEPAGPVAPRFHARGVSCGLNDPNGMFWDPKHGLYHLFWQAHESMVHNATTGNGTVCGGPVWGHAASRNLSHWTHLPVALWNDKWWDLHAVYSGSTTLVNGTPTIVCTLHLRQCHARFSHPSAGCVICRSGHLRPHPSTLQPTLGRRARDSNPIQRLRPVL